MIQAPFCGIIGLPIAPSGRCFARALSRPLYQALRSRSVFQGPIQNVLHKLKYRRSLGLDKVLTRRLAVCVRGLDWPLELVAPLPLSRKRLKERGYNQVGLVAHPLAAMLGWRFLPRAAVHCRGPRSQVGLSAEERKENVAGMFTAKPALIRDRAVLLVDDVATTGSTLSACAQSVLTAGARSVYALTLARALPQHGMTQV